MEVERREEGPEADGAVARWEIADAAPHEENEDRRVDEDRELRPKELVADDRATAEGRRKEKRRFREREREGRLVAAEEPPAGGEGDETDRRQHDPHVVEVGADFARHLARVADQEK